ncbi:chemokine-like receptor 1 [Carcharodon carcharias]|uniref:chemokine-like receptor 1 n=1 Tax=Carcharodon carcharias TaxID=13397 RepID=UPI001B7F092A|nr:chemokine-like receptor 1 [Carcharodon carcharias]
MLHKHDLNGNGLRLQEMSLGGRLPECRKYLQRVTTNATAVQTRRVPSALWLIETAGNVSGMDVDGNEPTNGSQLHQDDLPSDGIHSVFKPFIMAIYLVTFILGVFGNGVVIWATALKLKRTVNTVWFLGLAVADFAFSLFLPFSTAYIALDFHWPFGTALCKLSSGIAILTMFASILTLTAISVDRCVLVVLPVWSQNHREPRLAALASLALWGVSVVLSVPSFIFRDTAVTNSSTVCYTNFLTGAEEAAFESMDDVDYDIVAAEMESLEGARFQSLALSRLLFGFLLPLLVIGASYATLSLRLRRSRLAHSGKPFKVIIAIILAFLLCWAPYHICTLMELQYQRSHPLPLALRLAIPLSTSLTSFNSCLNPILYICMGHDFRQSFRRSLQKILENAFVEDSMHYQTSSQSKTKPFSLGEEGSTLV